MGKTATEATLQAELWTQRLVEEYKRHLSMAAGSKRDKATQALRDAALGHPEYPLHAEYDHNSDMYRYMMEMKIAEQERKMEILSKEVQHTMFPRIAADFAYKLRDKT